MRSFLIGLSVVFILLCLLILFVPIFHGSNLASALVHGIKQSLSSNPEHSRRLEKQKIEKEIKNQQFNKKLSKRFSGILKLQISEQRGSWQRGNVAGVNVWLDTITGMVWRDFQGYTLDGWAGEAFQQAKQYCHNLNPIGYWSLPTNAEFALGVKSKMQTLFADIKGRWIAQLHSQGLPMPGGMPSLVGFQNQGINKTSVRCIGITEMAPIHGYTQEDISNADALGLLTR
jgi:hypothetical protein